MNAIEFFEAVARDLRYAIRAFRKSPSFAVAAVLTLGLAIGGNTAMFSVVHTVLLKPLEYRDPDRLVRISGGATPVRFEEMKTSEHSFSEIGAFAGQENLTLVGGAEPEVMTGARVSANFLQILGVDPILGRSFRPEEDVRGGTSVAMISAELWRRRFARDSRIIGTTAILAGTVYTIVGVLPPRFQFPYAGVDVWMTVPSEWPLMQPQSRALSPFLTIFGRLKPGLGVERAKAEMAVIHRQYAMAHPTMLDAKSKSPGEVTPMKEQLVAKVHSTLWMLFGAVGFVLLIACANVANLLLARATSRSREFAVRAALGAGRARLVRQLLAESVLLSSAAGVIGVVLAAWTLRAIPTMTAFDLPRAGEIHLDWLMLGFAAALSMGSGVFFGLVPSLSASKPDLIRVLRMSGGAASQGAAGRTLPGFSMRGVLVGGQVALSVMLLIGAALLMESVAHLRGADVGFNATNLLTLRISLPLSRYDTNQKKTSFFEALLRRVGSSPGVRSATAAMFLPMTGFVGSPVQDADKTRLKLNERPIATVLVVTPDYFRTLGIPLRRGRDFTDHDADGRQRVAIIDEACARRFWPAYPRGEDPIGKRLLIGGANPQAAQIAGIVADVHQNLENSAWPETVYVSFAQDPQPSAMLAIRTEGDPLRFTRAVRQEVWALDRNQPIAAVRTMEDLLEEEVGQRRLLVKLLGSFAGVALLLALIGIYGVIAYSVARRTHEIGIRRALGAQRGDILRLVVGQGFGLALAGVTVGLGGAFGLTRVLKHLLFQVSTTDPETFAGVAVLFLLVALAASYIPAQRATRIDPHAFGKRNLKVFLSGFGL